MKALLCFIALTLAVPAFAQSARFALVRDVAAGGGAVGASAHFNLGSTAGEPVPSSTDTNNQFTVRSGFWIQPAPYVFAPQTVNGNFQFSFETQLGQIYQIQFADSLAGPAWQNLVTINGNGGIATATNSASGADVKFYRLIEQ